VNGRRARAGLVFALTGAAVLIAWVERAELGRLARATLAGPYGGTSVAQLQTAAPAPTALARAD
jgi:hypothetical protein